MFVYVAHLDGLVGGDPGRARTIHRFARRYLGAPFVYPVNRSKLAELDNALRGYSNGHHALRRG